MIYVAVVFLVLGLTMHVRGWIYSIQPDGKIAQKRKTKNLRLGLTTDMKTFGRKIRRIGFVMALVSGGLIAWQLSESGQSSRSAPTSTAD